MFLVDFVNEKNRSETLNISNIHSVRCCDRQLGLYNAMCLFQEFLRNFGILSIQSGIRHYQRLGCTS